MRKRVKENDSRFDEIYSSFLNTKEALLHDYNMQKEIQKAFFRDSTNIEELFVYMYQSSFSVSDDYSITDDVPQRGKTEDMFFYELMKRIWIC